MTTLILAAIITAYALLFLLLCQLWKLQHLLKAIKLAGEQFDKNTLPLRVTGIS